MKFSEVEWNHTHQGYQRQVVAADQANDQESSFFSPGFPEMLKIFLRKSLALRLFWYPFPDPNKDDADQQGWQDEQGKLN